MKTLDQRHQDLIFGLMDEIVGESPCHCGAVKEPSSNECSNCDHHRTEAMQDDLETVRREDQK